MLNKEKKVQPTSKSGNDAKPIVSGQSEQFICPCGKEVAKGRMTCPMNGIRYCNDCIKGK